MAQIDFSAAYRDSTKGATLKALALRRQKAAEEQAAAMAPRQIAAPSQGWAQIAGTVGAGIREGRAAAEETAGRSRLAELLAGGISAEEMGEATILDPELAMKHQERSWAVEDKAEQRKQELIAHGWDVDAATERARVEAEQQARLFGQQTTLQEDTQAHAAALQEDTQAAAKETAVTTAATADAAAKRDAALAPDQAKRAEAVKAGTMTQEQADALNEQDRLKAEADIAKAGPDTALPVSPEEAAKWGGDVAKNPQNYYIDEKTGKPALITPYNAAAATQDKTNWETKGVINSIDSTLNELTRAAELADDVLPLGALGQKGANLAGYAPPGMIPEDWQKRVDATKRFNQIMESGAMKRMAEELKGSTAYQEIQQYVRILADPNTSTDVKKQTIAAFLNKIQSERGLMREKLKAQGGEDIGDYVYSNPDVLPEGIGTSPATTEAPAAGGAAEVAKPADIPQIEWDNMTPEDKALFK